MDLSLLLDSPLVIVVVSCALEIQVTHLDANGCIGGTLQIPEESVESEHAGGRMGAGILECDVSFTHDRGLVCRHSVRRPMFYASSKACKMNETNTT